MYILLSRCCTLSMAWYDSILPIEINVIINRAIAVNIRIFIGLYVDGRYSQRLLKAKITIRVGKSYGFHVFPSVSREALPLFKIKIGNSYQFNAFLSVSRNIFLKTPGAWNMVFTKWCYRITKNCCFYCLRKKY